MALEFSEKKINFTEKNIREFKDGDTIYIKKHINGMVFMYLCKFRSFASGMVYAEIVSGDPNPKHLNFMRGTPIKAMLKNCYLWGKAGDESTESAKWFRVDGFAGNKN
jgi:hypothetical protein